MKRLTTDNPKDNIEAALNMFYAKGHEAWVRGGGLGPEYEDVSLFDFTRQIIKTHLPDVDLDMDDDDLSEMMAEWLFDGPDSLEGVIATLYTAAWAYAELRHRLVAYEDTGLKPEEVNAVKHSLMGRAIAEIKEFEGVSVQRLQELAQADKFGRTLVLPCKVGDTVYQICEERVYESKIRRIVYAAGDIAFDERAIGETVFLTREEAEAALRGGDG